MALVWAVSKLSSLQMSFQPLNKQDGGRLHLGVCCHRSFVYNWPGLHPSQTQDGQETSSDPQTHVGARLDRTADVWSVQHHVGLVPGIDGCKLVPRKCGGRAEKFNYNSSVPTRNNLISFNLIEFNLF